MWRKGAKRVTAKPSSLQILGVRHTDERVPRLILEQVYETVDGVYHETPETDSSTAVYAVATLLLNPIGFIVGGLVWLLFLGSRAKLLAVMVLRGRADELQWIHDGSVQGRRAANRIEDEYGVEWEPVGMNRVERVKNTPIALIVFSWLVMGVLLFSLLGFTDPVQIRLLLLFTTLGAIIGVTYLLHDARNSARDKRMFNNILDRAEGGEEVVVIVGENHVEGIASHAAAASIEYEAQWLSSTADLAD